MVNLFVSLVSTSAALLALYKCQQYAAVIKRMAQCSEYGCLNRQGLDLHWERVNKSQSSIVFFDIDRMKELNTELGYAEVNRRIASVFLGMRRSEVVIGRYFGGDEILIFCPKSEALNAAKRVQSLFVNQGLSATFAVIDCQSSDLSECVKPAADTVQIMKASGDRGLVRLCVS